jgi:hypothetical protein
MLATERRGGATVIIHCTKKLAARLSSVSRTPLTETSPLGSWHAHLYRIERQPCVAFCHDATRFLLFVPGMEAVRLRDIGRWHREALDAALTAQGIPVAAARRAGLALGAVHFDVATDRSVLSSMRIAMEAVHIEIAVLEGIERVDLPQLMKITNGRPAMVRGELVWPDRAMAELVQGL